MNGWRHLWLGSALVLAGGLGLIGGCGHNGQESPAAAGHQRYNVVLIVSDALRYDVPGCNGGPADTPHLDDLAARGVRFTQAHAAAPWTMPSAVALVTGRQAGVFLTDEPGPVAGRMNFKVPPDLPTLPRQLRQQGYELVLNAYNPNAWLAGNFHDFRRVACPGDCVPDSPAAGDTLRALSRVLPFRPKSLVHRRLFGCLRFLQTAPADRPFFVVNWFDDPHAPYHPESEFLTRVPPPPGKLRRRERYYLNHTNMHIFDHFVKDSLTVAGVQHFRDLYRAEVESVDERVGLILAMLRQRGLDQNTIVIFTADHGEGFNEHGLFEHGRSYYEELLHVPLIISGPGVPQGLVVDDPVTLRDLMATLAGLLDVPVPGGNSAPGFLAALNGEPQRSDLLYFDSASTLAGNDCRDALWQDGFKLITHQDSTRVELYDLARDPGETRNLAVGQRQRAEQMLTTLAELRRRFAAERNSGPGRSTGDSTVTTTPDERRKIRQKLKSLGYVN